MTAPKCGKCGQRPEGYAEINGVRYCHEGPSPTCYEQTVRIMTQVLAAFLPPFRNGTTASHNQWGKS